ncbi:MAG: hypothetical protein QXS32_06960 [Candidatus Nezhaarchaeales archaeon]
MDAPLHSCKLSCAKHLEEIDEVCLDEVEGLAGIRGCKILDRFSDDLRDKPTITPTMPLITATKPITATLYVNPSDSTVGSINCRSDRRAGLKEYSRKSSRDVAPHRLDCKAFKHFGCLVVW